MKEEGKVETKEWKALAWKGISWARAWQRGTFTPFLLATPNIEGESSIP